MIRLLSFITITAAALALGGPVLAEETPPDEAAYLAALAAHHATMYQHAAEAAHAFQTAHPDSPWLRKARFLEAAALIELRRFERAEAIYEAEAQRLLGEARKEDIARVILEFADALATAPDPRDPGAPPPNFAKAHNLYRKALDLEIGRALEDEIRFKSALAVRRANNPQAAIGEWQTYLAEFDPDWTGPVGSATRLSGRKRQNPPPAGAHVLEARHHLAEAQLVSGQTASARVNLEDLLALIPAPIPANTRSIAADSRWLLVKTHRLPKPPAAGLEAGVAAARTFLTAFAEDPRTVVAAWWIAESYLNLGRSDPAVEAYVEFTERKGFRLPVGEARDAPLVDAKRSPAVLFDEWRKLAVHRIGVIRFRQRRFEDAIGTWRRYVREFPDGPQWAEAQRGIIDAKYEQGLDAVADGQEERAREVFAEFLRSYPLDGRARQILFLLGQIHHVRAEKLESGKGDAAEIRAAYTSAVEEWSRLVGKYSNTEESSLALYRIGLVQEEKLGDLEAALKSYRRLTWGSWARRARARVTMMTATRLEIETERTWRTHEAARVKVHVRNLEKLTVKRYTLDLEAYFRKTHGATGIDALDITLIQPDRTWTVDVADYGKYRPLSQEIEIPFDAERPGVCLVSVGNDDLEATTLVIRSDIDLIVKSNRTEALVFAQDMRRDAPAPGVRLLLSDGEKVFATEVTGEDGVFRGRFDSLETVSSLRVLAVRDGHVAAHAVSLKGLSRAAGLTPRGFIYTDRPAYRPGQTVGIRGIIRDVKDGSYVVPEGETWIVGVLDAQGRLIHETRTGLSAFGTFSLSVPVDETAPLGRYTVSVRHVKEKDKAYGCTFLVQRFALEKMRLEITAPRPSYFRGESVELTVAASYAWGEPIAGRMIRVDLPDGRMLREKSDESGEVTVAFDSTGTTPGTIMSFSASIEGENVSTTKRIPLARLGFELSVRVSDPIVLAGAPFDVVLKAVSPDGKPQSRKVTLTVLRRKVVPVNPVLAGIPWVRRPARPAAEETVEELEVTTDETTGEGTLRLDLDEGGRYVLRASGEDRFGQVVTAVGSVTISAADDATRLRFFADSGTVRVGETTVIRLHSRLEGRLALLTFDGETILSHRVLRLRPGMNDVQLDLDHEHFPNFRVTVAAMDGRDLRVASRAFAVERQLRLTVRPRQDAYAPGAPGRVEIIAVDQLGQPVRAEVSLALVDDALYGRYPDTTPPILDFFQRGTHRQAQFRVIGTNAFAYRGVTRAVDSAIKEEQARLAHAEKEAAAVEELRRVFGRQASVRRPATAAPPPSGEPADRLDAPPGPPRGGPGRDAGVREEAKKGFTHGGKAQAEVREEIPEAGWWLPAIVTGEDGKALVELPLPETTTRWRLTARGASVETLVGEARATVITRKDFFVEFKAPASLTEGDELRVLARLHDLTGRTGAVDFVLTVFGGLELDRVLVEKMMRTEILADAETEVLFDAFTVPADMTVRVQVAAVAGEARDAVARTIPVRPWGIEYADHGGGVSRGHAVVRLELPGRREYTSRWLTVSIGPSLERSIVEMALHSSLPRRFGGGRRYGANPASDLLAATAALRYARAVGAPALDIQRLTDRVRALVGTLVTTQRGDGTWAWSAGSGPSDNAICATTLWALSEARKLGIPVHTKTTDAARAHLEKLYRVLGASDNEGKAVILHGLAEAGHADFAHANRLYRERNKLGTSALARTALTFLRLDRKPIAAELVDLLLTKRQAVKADGRDLCFWSGSPNRGSHWYLDDELDATAMTLLALLETRPDSARVREAVDFLMHRRGAVGFSPAKARGPAVAALAGYFSRGKYAETDTEIQVLVNGKPVRTVTARGERPVVVFPVAAEVVGQGPVLVEFRTEGRGEFAYAATLRGFSPNLEDPKSWRYPYVRSRHYYHDQLRYRQKPIGVNSTTQVENVAIGQHVRVHVDLYHRSEPHGYLVVEESIPAGLVYVKGSLRGHQARVYEEEGRLVLTFPPGLSLPDFSYELVGYATGKFRILPTVIRDTVRPDRMRLGRAATLRVLAPGEASDDPYVMNHGERFRLATLHFTDRLYREALGYLTELFEKARGYNERDVARMMLWIHTSRGFYDARRIVAVFEVLRERYPALQIPFDKILVVGRAYRDMKEYERAYHVFRATIDASFIHDAGVSAVLEDEGQFLGSIDYQENVWREYPDTAQVTSAYFAISQSLYEMAPKAHELEKQERRRARNEEDEPRRVPERIAMLKETIRLLESFLTLYPRDPLADDAAFSLANAWLDLKQYRRVVAVCRGFETRFEESTFTSGYRYMRALGHFWQNEHDKALTAAKVVGEGESEDRDLARYIVGQIYHAEGKPADAIGWYRKVAKLYPDAREAIDYFEEKRIGLDEVTIVRPGETVELTLDYRNIREASLQVYRVDLMKLYLREKNLSTITKVHLAGIRPEVETAVALGDGRDYVDKERKVRLDLTEEAAYLVICRGDDLFASGLVLITPLKIEVQTDATSGRLRANVLDAVTGGYAAEVHVKAIGSAGQKFKSGETDLRGVFVADGLRGKATVIARAGDSRYAFYRGSEWLGAPENVRIRPGRKAPRQQESLDFRQNLRQTQSDMQESNRMNYDRMRRQGSKGVEVQQAR